MTRQRQPKMLAGGGRDRAVTSGVSTILMVALVVLLGTTLFVAFGTLADVVAEPPTAAFDHQKAENGASDDVVTVTLAHGDSLRTDRLLLVASKPVDLGGSDTAPNPSYATVGEKLSEGDDQVGVGDTWNVGESIRFGANGDLEGVTIRLVWNPTEVDKDGAGGREPSELVGEDAHVLLRFTIR